MIKRFFLGGAPLDAASAKDAASWVIKRFEQGKRTCVTPVNAAIVNLSSKDQCFSEILANFDLALADGFWPALAATLIHKRRVPHTNTLPFLRALFDKGKNKKLNVFLLGAKKNVVEKAVDNLKVIHPEIVVSGFHDGYFLEDQEEKVIELINKSKSDILLLGMSSPKKEFFINKNWQRMIIPVSIGVGGLFDIWAGEIKEAKPWIRACGFEWLFRLGQEPHRMLKRYTLGNINFILIIVTQLLKNVFSKHKLDL
jgi:N-acetylglucosaminyldiphosphoundecaprenol N-acetyl-beta-D-mannosaminyltransferase